MKTLNKWLIVLASTLAMAPLAIVRSAHACDSRQPLTYHGGFIDAWDAPKTFYYLFWGFGATGDPLNFVPAATAVFDDTALGSFGIAGTRFFGVPTQYSGPDYDSAISEEITNKGAMFGGSFSDEGNLPPPVGGVINVTDPDVAAEVDRIFDANHLSSLDDEILVMLPPGVPAPVSACGQHFSSPEGHVVAWIVYPGTGCSVATDQFVIVHEITETAANPFWDHGATAEGWDQGTGAVCEIGDLCENTSFTIQTQPASSPFSQVTTQPFQDNEAVNAGVDGCAYGRGTSAAVFGLGTDNQLWETSIQADTALTVVSNRSMGKPVGVTLTGTPGASSWGDGHWDAFVRGTDGKMYHASTDDAGSTVSWESLVSSASFTQSPDAVSWGAGNVQVYAVQNHTIVKNTKDFGGSWSGWTTVAGPPSGAFPVTKVTVASWGASNKTGAFPTTNRTVVAAFRSTDGTVWMGNAANGGPFTWKGFNPPKSFTGDLDISAWAPPRLDLFLQDTNGNFVDMFSNNGTTFAGNTTWTHPSQGGFQVGPGAAGMGDGRLVVGGRVGGVNSQAFLQLWNWHGTAWVPTGLALTSGIDIASW